MEKKVDVKKLLADLIKIADRSSAQARKIRKQIRALGGSVRTSKPQTSKTPKMTPKKVATEQKTTKKAPKKTPSQKLEPMKSEVELEIGA